MSAGVLAHQGGWDEILMVLTPISAFAGLLWLANKRADDQVRARDRDRPPTGDDDRADGDGEGGADGDGT